MAKSKKFKKAFFSGGLVAVLLCINCLQASAGTDREFWNMSIRSYRSSSVLTTRYKETNLQYSLVRVTSMKSIGKIYTSFVGATYDISDELEISSGVNTGKWLKQVNTATQTDKGSPIALSSRNYNWSSSTGSLSGWVDYE
ncbi:hypothetical protein [Clostridium estertheticum]|uniref:hypothetical protein n=1 Tax=Clostridium estertheticum TaxID=238834 RepID=UPI001C0DEF31|nr:hypothetical protein [Clostridium estertheticum]MBU3174635.1 hypothetical protein [Clostridium estertheticum]MBU3187903.1 hypothetical protein [Clostridium estertheticum]